MTNTTTPTKPKKHPSQMSAAELREYVQSPDAQLADLQGKVNYLNKLTWGPDSHESRLQALEQFKAQIDVADSKAEDNLRTVEDSIKLLIEARNDQALRIDAMKVDLNTANGRGRENLQLLSAATDRINTQRERLNEIENSNRKLQSSLMDTNKRIAELEARVYAIDLNKVPYELFTQLWRHEAAHKAVTETVSWKDRNKLPKPVILIIDDNSTGSQSPCAAFGPYVDKITALDKYQEYKARHEISTTARSRYTYRLVPHGE